MRVFFRRSSEHHSRNGSSSGTSSSHDSHVFSHSRTLVVSGTFLRVLHNNIHHHVAFARELEEKTKNTEQDQPAVRSAVAAPAAAAAEAAAAEASISNSNSTSSSSRRAEAAEDYESTSEHLCMYSVYSSTRFLILIFEDEKTVPGT